MPLLIFIGLVVLVLMSCNQARKGYIGADIPVVINLSTEIKHASLATYIDSVRLVPLEVNDNAIISSPSGIHKILYKENKYFLLDDKYMAIKVFDSTGKYLYNMGSLGVGKGQFSRVEDMEYNPVHHSILVLCNNPCKMIEFSLNGVLLREVRLEFWATSFAIASSNAWIFYVNQNNSKVSEDKNMILSDSNGIVQDLLFDLPPISAVPSNSVAGSLLRAAVFISTPHCQALII
ncbi:6-bladed beta-propeller [Paraflavitalea speifideaquila]|uniref:6-bladed beta-propeller n=1 Tax=Paraflavitalea speifideaquila TaxID=3076558 RepID=UPI0028F0981E|nr:6-bladed beta-propeller [Paraflavitalea speifideiaquila]